MNLSDAPLFDQSHAAQAVQPKPTLADEFIAKSASGTRYRVYIWQHWVKGSNSALPGRKEVRLATGERAKRIDDDTYEIAQTGVLIKRER